MDVRDSGFRARKWTLFAFCLVAIVLTIVTISVSVVFINSLDPDKTINDQVFEEAKRTAKAVIISVGVITILIQMLGLSGAYMENYCLTLTYAILMTIMSLISIWSALESSINWLGLVVNILVTILAYLFARDLHRLRTGAQTHTVYVTGQP